MSDYGLRISMWKKESNNLLCHRNGLTEDQIAELQKLKVGDRIIIYNQARFKKSDKSPDYSIAVLPKATDQDDAL